MKLETVSDLCKCLIVRKGSNDLCAKGEQGRRGARNFSNEPIRVSVGLESHGTNNCEWKWRCISRLGLECLRGRRGKQKKLKNSDLRPSKELHWRLFSPWVALPVGVPLKIPEDWGRGETTKACSSACRCGWFPPGPRCSESGLHIGCKTKQKKATSTHLPRPSVWYRSPEMDAGSNCLKKPKDQLYQQKKKLSVFKEKILKANIKAWTPPHPFP